MPSRKWMSEPTVNASAWIRSLSSRDSGPVWTRTFEKSAPKSPPICRCSTVSRGRPEPAVLWILDAVSSSTAPPAAPMVAAAVVAVERRRTRPVLAVANRATESADADDSSAATTERAARSASRSAGSSALPTCSVVAGVSLLRARSFRAPPSTRSPPIVVKLTRRGSAPHDVGEGGQCHRRAAQQELGDARITPPRQLLADLVGRADEGDVLHHLQWDGRSGLLLLALQIEVLHLVGHVAVAHPGEHLVVEVGALGAHPAGVQREERPHHVGALFDVVARDQHHRGRHLEPVLLGGVARRFEAPLEALPVEAVLLGREEQRHPSVA